MQIKAALAIVEKEPPQAIHLMENALQLTTEALLDVRNSVSSLREDNIGNLSLSERITKLISSSESEGRKFIFEVKGKTRSLSPQVDVSLFRVVQEAINNANKHSRSTELKIHLDFEQSDKILLKIVDNGIGSDSIDGGFGLIGMKERILLINGKFEIKTAKGQGFCIEVSVPA
jgi:two-component system sensor histidine kinase DegS